MISFLSSSHNPSCHWLPNDHHCVFACVRGGGVHVHVWAYMHMSPQGFARSWHQLPSSLYFETGSSQNLEFTGLATVAGFPRSPGILLFLSPTLSWDSRVHTTILSIFFLHGSWGLTRVLELSIH